MKKILSVVFALFVTCTVASAQNYDWSLGLRLGGNSGIAAKTVMANGNALEGILSFDLFSGDGFYFTGLYEWSTPVINNGFNLYYGAGANIGVYNSDFALGISGIVGLEYKFPTAPIALSLDWIPQFNLIPDTHFSAGGFGLTVKYCF